MKKLIIALLVFTLFISCERNEFIGKGDIVTKTLSLSKIDRFALEGSFDVFVKQGPTQEVIAEGEENIIDRLFTKVENGRWDIKLKSGNYTDFTLTITITTPDIEEMIIDGSGDVFIEAYDVSKLKLRSRGSGDFIVNEPMRVTNRLELIAEASGDISVDQLTCANLKVDIEGSGDVQLNAGSAQDAYYYVDGSGDIMAFNINTVTCSAFARSSGDIELTASDELDVLIDASGNIMYKGNPNISENITGSGILVNSN